MIRHIVAWKLNEENKESNAREMKSVLEALTNKIPEIRFLEVGINENGEEYDIILITKFDNFEDLKKYDVHPEHQKVKAFVKSIAQTRIAIDYEIK